ncbi:MAG: CerR family C-terminal domain-containing protein [Desulfamplus sp.]|nr:CerR family C-terminal domain-containing protein [Desulfamplus sp.]
MSEQTTMTTKQRIIKVAGDIFGQEGFKAATIRKIAEAANANVASINYHFRDKEGLYAAVLEDLFESGFKKFPSTIGINAQSTPEERLKAFIMGMFLRLIRSDGWGSTSAVGKGRLIAKEMMDPTPAFEWIIEKYIKPHKEILISILSDLAKDYRYQFAQQEKLKAGTDKSYEDMGDDTNDIEMDRLLPCAISIISQCIYYAFAAPVIQKVAQACMPIEENIERLANHVLLFSLGGVKNIVESAKS